MPVDDYTELGKNLFHGAVVNAPGIEPADPGIIQQIGTHLNIGAQKYAGMPIAGLTQMAGDALGVDALSNAGKNMRANTEAYVTDLEKQAPTQKFQDIDSVGKAGTYAVQQLAEFAPQAVLAIGTGGVGGAGARTVGSAALRSGLLNAERIAGNEALATAAEKVAAGQLTKNAAKEAIEATALNNIGLKGAQTANALNSIGMEASTIYQGQEDGKKDLGKAGLYGLAAGILDSAVPNYLMQKTGAYKLIPGMGTAAHEAEVLTTPKNLTFGQKVKDVAKIAGEGITEESAQEGVQTVLERIGSNQKLYSDEANKNGFWNTVRAKGIRAAVNPEAWDDIVESMAAGGLIGGVMGGGSSAAGHILAPHSSATVADNAQQVSAMPGQQADTSTGTAGASPAPGGADAMGNIPEFGSPTVARDSVAAPIAGGNQYQQFAENPFSNAPVQPAIAGAGVEGLLGNLKPVAADGSKNSLASALLAGGKNQYQQFADTPFANAPAQPAIAGPAVEGMLGSVQPAASSPRFQALQWAQQQMQDPATSKFERQNLNALMKAADPEKRDLVKYWASFTNQRKQPAAIAGVQSQQGAISNNDLQQGKTSQVGTTQTEGGVNHGQVQGREGQGREITADLPGVETVTQPSVTAAAAKPATRRDRSVRPAQDDMITAIGKLGGLDLAQVQSQWGSTVTDSKADLNRHASKEGKAGILHVISSKGKSLDAMREALEEHGYLPQGSSIEDMYAKIDQHLSGKPTYSNQNQQHVEDQDLSVAPEGVEASDYPFDLEGINFPEKDKKHLKFLKRMLAKSRNAKTRSKIEQAIGKLQEVLDKATVSALNEENKQNNLLPRSESVTERGLVKSDSFIATYLNTVLTALRSAGISPHAILEDVDGGALGKWREVRIVMKRGADIVGYVTRMFTNSGIKIALIEAEDDGKGGKVKMGAIPALYPAESDLANKFGVDLYGSFVSDVTREGFKKSNPAAVFDGDSGAVEYNGYERFDENEAFDDTALESAKANLGNSADKAYQKFYDAKVTILPEGDNHVRGNQRTLSGMGEETENPAGSIKGSDENVSGVDNETPGSVHGETTSVAGMGSASAGNNLTTRNTAKHQAFLKRMLKNAKTDKARAKIQQGIAKLEARTKTHPTTIDEEINSMSLDDMAALFSQAVTEAAAPAPVRNRARIQEAQRKKLAKQLAKTADAREQKRLIQSIEKLQALQAKLEAENKPAEQTGKPEKDNGAESYFKKGDRVQFANGVHGEVVSVDSYTVTSAKIGLDHGGMYTHDKKDERHYMYRVRKDNGVEVSGYFAEMFNETDPAPEVVPGPVFQKQAYDPDSLLQRIKSMRDGAESARAAAGRAKKADKIKEHNATAAMKQLAADDMQAAFDAWAEQHPEEAAKYAPVEKPVASPAPVVAGSGIEGLKVTFNAAQNGIELRFAGKPDDATLAKIKANGFRWAMGKKIWYAKDTPARRTFVEGLQGKQASGTDWNAKAAEIGKQAFENGESATPAKSEALNQLIKQASDAKEGHALQIITAFTKAWHQANVATPVSEEIGIAPGVIVTWKAPSKEVVAVVQRGPDANGFISVKVTHSEQKGISKGHILNQHIDNVKALGHHIEYMGDGPMFGADSDNQPSTRSAADILGAAAKSGVKGADEALKGLYELFGGKSLKSFPGAVDEDTYRAAKPHFTAALENFRSAGKSLKEFFSFLIDQFGAGIQPYVMKYMQEKQQESGILKVTNQEAANNDNSTDGGTGQGSLESSLPGTVSDAAAERQAEQGSGSISGTDHEGDGNTDEGGHVRSGSLAGQPESVHIQPGEGAEGSAVLPSGATGATGSVSTPSEPRTLKLSGDNPGNYRITAADDLGGGTRGDKINNNLAAIRLVKQLDKEGRYPTRAEQSILAKYVGWGGLKSVFDPNSTKPQDQKARTELEQLLTEAEYFEARQSVLNAHYTSPEIIGSIYSILQHMGFKGGNVLEPTYGSGNFIGLMPEQMAAASKWYGSELDPVTSKIGKFLYPDAQLIESGFQDAEFPYGKFDLAIGNPPFGSEQITDTNKKRAEIDRFKIHNYVIAKSGMHLRPGGVMAMVVTSRFMDTANPEARDYLAKQFKFLTAIRLPNDAFAKNAGTEVTTDLVFFQKLMPGELPEDQYKGWLETASTMTNAAGEEITLNKWFAKRPELMLGEPSMKGTMYGGQWRKDDGKGEFTLNARPGQDTAAEIEKILAGDLSLQSVFTPTPAKSEAAAVSIQMNREDIGIGGYVEENGQIFMREDDDQYGNPVFVKLTADTPWTEKQALGETRLNRIKGMLDLRKAAYALIEAERFDLSDMEAKRKELNHLYDAFVSKHGFLSDSANASLMADDVKIESGLEVNYRKAITAAKAKTLGVKAQPAKADKAAIMKQRVFFPVKEITSAANSRDGYGISLSEKGRLDLAYIAGLTGQTTDAVIKELADEGLIFKDPATGTWKQEDEYLSGNVKAKLQKVLGREGFEKNVEALTEVLPKDVTPEEIFADLGATWIPAEVYKEFADLMGVTNANVLVIPETGTVKIISGGHVQNDMNVMLQNPDHDVASLINHIAAKQAVVAYDSIPDGNGGNKRVVNKDRTKALVPMVKRVSATFRDWLMADPRRATELTKIYNDTMNTHAPRTYNGKHLKTVGASPAVRLRNSQRNASWRMLQSPVVLLDHVVGAGKTFTIITGVMERKRLGLSNKSMIVVPNHLVGQWGADFLKLYPGARILATTEKDFKKNNRKRLFARIATGNYDAVIVGHSSFGFVPLEPETQQEFMMEEVRFLERALTTAKDNKDSKTVRNITERIKSKTERIKSLMNKERDDVVTFENMGVDNLVVDESHEFKNLEYSTSMQNITGMGNPKGAKKSFDLYAKIQYLRSNDGAVTFATGTPISNSLVEMYTILRYLNRQGLKDRNLDVFDAWAKAYASIESRIEYTPSQKLKDRQVMATFNNLPELLQLYSEFADVISMKDLKRIYAEQIKESNKATGANEREEFPVPKVKNGARYLDVADPTPAQRQYMDYLVARANRLEKLGGQNDPKTDNHLWLMNDARKMALDIRLVDPSAPADPDNKVNRAANNIKRIYDQWNADKGTQLVFCDLSTPAGSSKSEAAKFIKSGMTVLGLEKDKALANTLNQLSYSEQWTYLKNRIELKIEELSESETVTDADEELREKLEKYLDEVDDNDIAALQTVDTGFSVYDDLKATLIDKGIPASEIRFIHEANTRDQKTELFNMVNSGLVRVLIGSSRKMGAGTNAQERLVGLHHMDAPWRPSDVEQREGRIIRQGNMLYERDPDNFEVEIPAYSTRNTFDSVSWQILARKAEMLEDFRSGARSMQDSESDAASYSEFMAESTGNPIFREKFRLEREIEELESTERNIMARRAAGERIVKNADADIAKAEKTLQSALRDMAEVKDAKIFEVDGKKYADDLTEAYNKAYAEYETANKEYTEKLLPEYVAAMQQLEEQELDDKAKKEAKKLIKKPVEPAKPTLPRLEKSSQAARAALRVSELLDDVAERGEVEFQFGGSQVVIQKIPAGNGIFDFKTSINGTGRWALSANGLKHMSQQKLMELFNTGEIASRVAADLRVARAAVESVKQSIDDAERTLSKLKFEDADKLKAMQERYKAVVEEVNQLEKDLDKKREQEANSYISGDGRRFGGEQFSLASPTTTGLNAAELQKEFDGVPFNSRIKVVQSADQLPGFGSQSLFSKMVEGQYKNGTIYLVADNLPSVERARVVALGHELTHAGQSEKLTDLAVQWFRDAMAKGANGSKFQQATVKILNQEARKRGYKLTDPADFRKAVQEATAVIAETAYRTGDKAGLMTKLLMYIKHFFRTKLGIKLEYTDKELVATVLEMMRQGAKNLTNGNGPNGGQRSLAASKPFYSAVEQMVINAKQNAWGSARELANWLTGKVSKDEIEQLGLDKMDGKLTKQQVLDEIKSNTTEFKDVVLGEFDAAGVQKAAKELRQLVISNDNLGYDSATEAVSDLRDGKLDPENVEWNTDEEASRADELVMAYRKSNGKPTHFSQYTEPGAVDGSYREMFVTAPDIGSNLKPMKNYSIKNMGGFWSVIQPDGNASGIFDNEQDAIKSMESRNRLNKERQVEDARWQDGHSQYSAITNPIVRIRFNDREVDGKRILFVEEMQGPSDANQQKMPDYLRKRIYDIGVKRILAYAKENGYDGISWTTGDMQAKRYDLSKHLDTVQFRKDGDRTRIVAIAPSGDHVSEAWHHNDDLDSVVGKDLANKILQDDRTQGQYSGLDLKVGGEGLKSLYDRTLPALFKKYGKGQMREVGIASDRSLEFDPSSSDNPARDYIRAKEGEMTVPFTPITDTTPASYPQYSLASSVSSALSDVDWKEVATGARDNWKQTLNPFDWSRTKQWFDDWTPESIKAAFGYLFAVPHFQAERDATKRPFVDTSENREIYRMDLMLQMLGFQPGKEDTRSVKERMFDFLTKWQSGQHKTDWEQINQRRADLSADQKKALDALFVEGDVSGVSYTGLDKALLNPRIARTKPDATTFALYRDIRDHMSRVSTIVEQQWAHMMRENGVDEAAIQKSISDYRHELRKVGGWMTRNHGDGEYSSNVYHLVKDLKFNVKDVEGGKQAFLPYFPGNAVMTRLEVLAKESGLKIKTTPKGAVVVTGSDISGFLNEAAQIIPQIGEQRVMVFSRYHQTKGAARNHAELIKKDLKAAMPHNFRAGEEYEVISRQVDKLNESMFQNMKSDMAVEAALEQSAQRALKRGEMTKEEFAAFKTDLMQNTAEVMLGRAAGKYQIRRAPYLIEGYDTENAVSLYQDYMMGVSGMITKADYAAKQFDNYRKAAVPVKAWAAPYIFDSLRNQGLGDRISGNMRAFASLWYMGLKPASALINATQNYTLGIAELGRHVKGSPLVMVGKANADIIKGKLSQDENLLFESAIYRQQEMSSALSEITGHNEGTSGKAGKLLHNLTAKSLALFQNVEVMNRKTMILAAYRAFRQKDLAAGMLDHQALMKAVDINNSINFNMHRGNLPGWARTPVGHTLYALQSFTFNSFNWMYNRLTSGEKQDMIALLRYAGAIMAIAGVAALPGGDELDKLYRKLFNKSLKLEFQQFTHKNLKQYGSFGELVDAFAWHGLGGAAGLNISNSLRLQIPVVSQVLSGESAPEAMGGVFSGLIQKASTATKAAAKGDWYRATEAAAPEAISGAMRAYRQATRGVTTMGGKQVFDENGKPVKYSAADAGLRMMGLQPLEQSRRTEVAQTAKEITAEWHSNRQDVIDSFRIADTLQQKQKALKLVQEFNVELRGSQAAGLVQPISMQTLRNAAQQRTSKADKKKAAWQQNYLN